MKSDVVQHKKSYLQGYMVTSVRLDRKPRCQPGNKPCGDRCIPVNQECHVGEVQPRGRNVSRGAAVTGGAIVATGGMVAAYLGITRRQQILQRRDQFINQVYTELGNQTNKAYAEVAQDRDLDKKIDGLKISDDAKNQIRNLVGKTRVMALGVISRIEGAEVVGTGGDGAFVTLRYKHTGALVSLGSAGTKVVSFTSSKTTYKDRHPSYRVGFSVDNLSTQHKDSRRDSKKIIAMAKQMFDHQIGAMEDTVMLSCDAENKDSLGKKRGSIYTRYGFFQAPGTNDPPILVAGKVNGKFKPIKNEKDFESFQKVYFRDR